MRRAVGGIVDTPPRRGHGRTSGVDTPGERDRGRAVADRLGTE
jgi:hypothetical protein